MNQKHQIEGTQSQQCMNKGYVGTLSPHHRVQLNHLLTNQGEIQDFMSNSLLSKTRSLSLE